MSSLVMINPLLQFGTNHLEDCLKPCLESIIKNTDLSSVEVIVVANGCTDGTKDYVNSLGKSFKLVWIEEAAGYSRATNAGIKTAYGVFEQENPAE